MNRTSVRNELKENVAVLVQKLLSSVCSSVMEKYIQKSFLTALRLRYRPLYVVEFQESIVHSDGWRGDNGLVDLGCKRRYYVQPELMNLQKERTISMI